MPATVAERPRPMTARERLTRALAEYGVTAHVDDDAGNSWLVVNMHGDTFPGVGTPQLVAYVYDDHEDWVFVNEPMEHCAGTWRVHFNDGTNEELEFRGTSSDPATETTECAAFIADRLRAPTAS
ncbi:hypothetical protein [Streptomyces europaeiscabiei]|uniref:hypothetical protein n=1 Tax=Streptomyces europaeiscabiei TaxID=146819 RepID=UPI0038F6F159